MTRRPFTDTEIARAEEISRSSVEALAREALAAQGNPSTLALVRERAYALTARGSYRLADAVGALSPATRIAHDILLAGSGILSGVEFRVTSRSKALSDLAQAMDSLD